MAKKRLGKAEVLRRAKAYVAKQKSLGGDSFGRSVETDNIAKACGVTSPALRYHFGSIAAFRKLLGCTLRDSRTDPPEVLAEREAEREAREQLARDKVRIKAGATISELKRQLRELEHAHELSEKRIEFLTALDTAPPANFKIAVPKAQPRTGLPIASYFAAASDWHVGERVRKAEVHGLNEYNPDIARERARQFFKSNRIMLNAARSAWTIRHAVLLALGDFMTGWIHEDYVAENFMSPIEEMLFAFELLEEGIIEALATWDIESLDIYTANGNHGRVGKKKTIAGAFRTSYEFGMYKMLARRFADNPRVRFHVTEGYYGHIPIYGRTVRVSHGDEIMYSGGVGGITVPFYRRRGREADVDVPVPILVDVFGHHHTLGFPRRAVTNGSLIGPTPFGVAKGFGAEAPMQASFVVDSLYGLVSNMNPILVEKAKK